MSLLKPILSGFPFRLAGHRILCLLCLSAAQSVLAGGVTLITHGFNSDVASWIIPMQSSVALYPGLAPSNSACYEITITQSSGVYSTTATFLSGTNPLAAASGEILIKLNWASLSGLGGPSTLVIATNAANALLNTNLIPALGGRALAELPLHLAGHSRGASVVAEMSRLLGAQGVWVDHFTGLDPVPVGSFNDPAMKLYGNIFYADNYWQNLNAIFLDPQGQSLPGAYNRKLTNLSGAAASAHSDVHLWYHGTIDFRTPLKVDGASISNAQRTAWWMESEQQGTNAGYRLSLVGGGNRYSTNEPAGAGNGRINDGVNRLFDFGLGATGNRTVLPANNGSWPNPLLLTHGATTAIASGAPFEIFLTHQSGTNSATNVTMRLLLDVDANPFNTNETLLAQETIPGTGTTAVTTRTRSVLAGASPGSYRLLTRLTFNGRTRHLYAAAPVIVTPAIAPPVLTVLGVMDGGFAFRIHATAGQTVVTESSTNFLNWTPIATNALPSANLDVTNALSSGTPEKFFRARSAP